MFVEVGGLAKALATLKAGIGLLPRVDADVLLAVCQRQEGLAADLTGVLPGPLHDQDVVLRQRLLTLGQDVCRGPRQLGRVGAVRGGASRLVDPRPVA